MPTYQTMRVSEFKPSFSAWLVLLAISNVFIHLIAYNNLEAHRDELLYFSLSLHPAFGYASVPPLTGWLAWCIQNIGGFNLLAIKLAPALGSGFFVVLCGLLARALGGKGYAQLLAGLVSIVMPFSLRVFHLYQPVFLDLLFWTLAYYVVVLYINSNRDTYLIYLGVIFGLGLLNKYLIGLLVPVFFFSFVWTPLRNVVTKKSFAIGVGLAMLIVMPNIIWQYVHHFPVMRHMQELNANQLIHVRKIEFIKDQLFMPFAGLSLILPGLYFLWRDSRYRPVGVSTVLVVGLLLLLKGKSYYTIGIFPVLLAAGSVFWEKKLDKKSLKFLLPLSIVVISIPVVPFGLPILSQTGLIFYFKKMEEKYGLNLGRTFEDGSVHSLPQDYADQLGWEELTQITEQAFSQIPDKSKALIYAENYGQAGAISIIGKKYGLPAAVSFNDSYRYWVPRSFNPDIEYFIYINDDLGDDVQALFKDIHKVGSITNIHAREYGTSVYLCSQPKESFNKFWAERITQIQ